MSSQEHLRLKDAAYAEAAQFALPDGWADGRVSATGNTVDGHLTRDKDDAILLSNDRGIRYISVAIADTGTFLQDAPAVEAYAREMGETRYLHAGNIPMIPPRISEGILSILADKRQDGKIVPTPVITAHMSLGRRAMTEIGPPELVRESITPRSYTYARIASLTAGEGSKDEVRRWRGYEAVAHELLARRREQGAFAYYDAEKRVMADEDGNLVELRGRNMAGQLIVQEFMILANTAMAGYMARHNIPALYRNHHLRAGADPNQLARLLSGEEVTLDLIKSVYARARYSPHLEGHAGLNLRAYLHFTSPLRRFADFVNHANLAAHLDERDFPYQGDALQEIAEHLNSVQDETRRTKRESDVARIAAAAGAMTASGSVAKPRPPRNPTDTKELKHSGPNQELSFGNALALAAKTGNLPVAVADKVRQQLAAGRLTAGKMALLLDGRLAGDEVTADLRKNLLEHLATNPGDTAQIMNSFNQTRIVGTVTRRERPLPEGGFSSEFVITDDEGNEVVSESAQGTTKNLASHRAGLLLIAKLNGQAEAVQNLSGEGSQKPPENHKGNLKEALEKRGMALPEYAIAGTSEGFECVLTVHVKGETYTFSGKGRDKKLAEQAAAEAAQKGIALPPLPASSNTAKRVYAPKPPKLTAAEKKQLAREEMLRNPIVQLDVKTDEWHGNTFGTDNTAHKPKYSYEWTNTDPQSPEFECTVDVLLKDGSTMPFSAKGGSKAKAKRAAAAVAMEFVTSQEK